MTTARGTGTSPFRLGRITVSAPLVGTNYSATGAGGVGVGGQEFFGVYNRSAIVLTATAARPRVLRTVDLSPILPPSSLATALHVAPSGGVGVLRVSTEMWVVTLPSFSVVGVCPLGGGNGVRTPVKFDGTTTAAYFAQPFNSTQPSQLSVARIDLATGACEELLLGPKSASSGVTGVLPQPNRTLLLSRVDAGSAILDVDPQSAQYGTLTTPWTLPGIEAGELFPSPGNEVFFQAFVVGNTGYYVPFSSPATTPILRSTDASPGLVDGTGRYLLIGFGPRNDIIDMALSPPRVVREGLGVQPAFGAAVPNRSAFILSSYPTAGIVRVDIDP